MFLAQLGQFLAAHHHLHWSQILTTCSQHRYEHIYHWALRHGFVYQR